MRTALATSVLLLAAGCTGPEAPTTEVPSATAEVTRGTVSQRFRIVGDYGFDGAYTIIHRGRPGVVTKVLAPGARVRRGGVLYRAGGAAVRLLYGTTPAYRDLDVWSTDGEDVRQLERNLRALGMDPDHRMTVDTDFTAATAAAVRRLTGGDGRLTLGEVVFLPGEVRVSTVKTPAGAGVTREQPVLTGTTTRRVVTADLSAGRQDQIKTGDAVRVRFPGSTEADGRVLRVGRVATAEDDAPATVELVMSVEMPSGAPDLDQASVQVTLTATEHADVLVVPVSALLAAPGGGYRVGLADGTFVTVEPGLFDDSTGMVEVTGGVHEGDRVGVPES